MANILIADDEKDVIELIKFMLERDGHHVCDVSDGQQAIEAAEKEQFDLMLLDVMMPKMDGYSLAVYFRENADTNKIPVIIMTAKKGMGELFQSLTNVVEYVQKPFDPSELKSIIRKILNK